jgi:hypothetical protein
VSSILQGSDSCMWQGYWLLDFACHFVFKTQHHISETLSFPSLSEIWGRHPLRHFSFKSVLWVECGLVVLILRYICLSFRFSWLLSQFLLCIFCCHLLTKFGARCICGGSYVTQVSQWLGEAVSVHSLGTSPFFHLRTRTAPVSEILVYWGFQVYRILDVITF